MDYSSLRGNVAAGAYGASWEAFEADFLLIFENAMAYNKPNTQYHRVARALYDHGVEAMWRARQGKIAGKTKAQKLEEAARAHEAAAVESAAAAGGRQQRAAAAAAQQRTARQAEELGARKGGSHRAAPGAGKRGGAGGVGMASRAAQAAARQAADAAIRERSDDGEVRWTFQKRLEPSTHVAAAFNGLSGGGTADGAMFAAGRPTLKPSLPAALLPDGAYARSVARFVSNCPQWLQNLVMGRVAPALPAAAAAAVTAVAAR